VSFPLATSTGINAFAGCTVLIAVSFPLATSIGGNAFSSCAALTTVDFPLATTTGESAFYNCTALTTVSFPELISLGNSAFYQCTALTTVSFPKLTTIGDYPFRNTGDKTLTIILPQAAPALSSIGIIFDTYAKTVIIKTPASRTGYDATWETNFKKAFGNSATVTLSFENL
jgi:hypothetical protein